MIGLASVLESVAGIRVLIVGEAMLDRYIEGRAARLCQEAPVPVVTVSGRAGAPGGAANTALNVASLGGIAELASVVGDDDEADEIERMLGAGNVRTSGLVRVAGRRTLTKDRVSSDSQVLVRFDDGDTHAPNDRDRLRLRNALRARWSRWDAVIVSDYGYGVLSPDTIAALRELQGDDPKLLLVDSKDLTAFGALRPTIVKPNAEQAAALIGGDPPEGPARVDWTAERGELLLQRVGAGVAAVTFDCDGALFLEASGDPYRTYVRPGDSSHAAGAGDTFAAALTLAVAAGADLPASAELASAAAAAVVDRKGTSACSVDDVLQRFTTAGKRVQDPQRLGRRLSDLKSRGWRVVFTNGCFDLLHRGHVSYLSKAKSLGDVLVVGVNSDDGVRRLKGPGRPVVPLEDRMEVLAALSCVDHVIPFAQDTPVDFIQALKPDVFVKGGDYTIDTLPEAPVVESLGGVVHVLPYLEDHSTTSILERIRSRSHPQWQEVDDAS